MTAKILKTNGITPIKFKAIIDYILENGTCAFSPDDDYYFIVSINKIMMEFFLHYDDMCYFLREFEESYITENTYDKNSYFIGDYEIIGNSLKIWLSSKIIETVNLQPTNIIT